MFLKSGTILLTAGLIAVTLGIAVAQQNNPTGNQGSNRSITATPGTADNSPGSATGTGSAGSRNTGTSNYGGSAANTTTPGATGRTIVPGSTSSQASSAAGTAEQKTGATSTGGSGGGGGR
jgi:hypothetical protein